VCSSDLSERHSQWQVDDRVVPPRKWREQIAHNGNDAASGHFPPSFKISHAV
jgi:hypothetical protein